MGRGRPKSWHAGVVAPVQFQKGLWWAVQLTPHLQNKSCPTHENETSKSLIPKLVIPLHQKVRLHFCDWWKSGCSLFFGVFWIFLNCYKKAWFLNLFFWCTIFFYCCCGWVLFVFSKVLQRTWKHGYAIKLNLTFSIDHCLPKRRIQEFLLKGVKIN